MLVEIWAGALLIYNYIKYVYLPLCSRNKFSKKQFVCFFTEKDPRAGFKPATWLFKSQRSTDQLSCKRTLTKLSSGDQFCFDQCFYFSKAAHAQTMRHVEALRSQHKSASITLFCRRKVIFVRQMNNKIICSHPINFSSIIFYNNCLDLECIINAQLYWFML